MAARERPIETGEHLQSKFHFFLDVVCPLFHAVIEETILPRSVPSKAAAAAVLIFQDLGVASESASLPSFAAAAVIVIFVCFRSGKMPLRRRAYSCSKFDSIR